MLSGIAKWLLIGFLLGVFFSPMAKGNSINASSCSSTDVQTAISSASSGDTVMVPSGSCTWSSTVHLANGVSLQGQTTCTGSPLTCKDNTVITMGNTGGGAALKISAASSVNVIVTGFTFQVVAADQNNGAINLGGDSSLQPVRFHHNHVVITSSTSTIGAIAVNGSFGLIDHVVFDNAGSNEHTLGIHGDWATAGFLSWSRPLSFGTNQALYIEDCVFNLTNQTDGLVDGYTGGRIVFRHNTAVFTGATSIGKDIMGFHGTDSGTYRSWFSSEVYSNTFTNNSGGLMTSFRSRGGTSLIYSNTYNGDSGFYGITLQNYRADGSGNASAWGNCDGTNWKLESIDPTTQAGRTNSTNGTVFWCNINRDTTATSNSTCSAITPGDTATAYFDGNPGGTGGGAAGYACRDNVGRTHNQALAPVYEWLNSPDPGIGAYGASAYIVKNRDFYAYTATFTGNSGDGSGLLSARPSSCTPMVAYWATDTQTLYQCSSANTWTPYYTPYAYPHPLQGLSSNGGLAPPMRLTALVQ